MESYFFYKLLWSWCFFHTSRKVTTSQLALYYVVMIMAPSKALILKGGHYVKGKQAYTGFQQSLVNISELLRLYKEVKTGALNSYMSLILPVPSCSCSVNSRCPEAVFFVPLHIWICDLSACTYMGWERKKPMKVSWNWGQSRGWNEQNLGEKHRL